LGTVSNIRKNKSTKKLSQSIGGEKMRRFIQ